MKPYPSYKDSGVEWIGEIPTHWARKNLKYSFKIQKGEIPKETFDEPNESSLPYLTMNVLRDNATPHYCDISDGVKVKNKDLLILWDGSKSGEILYGNDGILSSTMSKMDLIDSNLEKPFCYYLLKYYERDFQYNTVGMGIPHMDGDHLKFSKLIIPPLPEQKRIVSFLNHKTQKIDELIEKTEQKIELLKERRTSLINHCVTKGLNPNVEMKDSGVEWIGDIPINWVRKKLGYIVNLQGRIGYKGYKKTDFVDDGEGCLVIGGKHLNSSQKLDLTNPDFLNWDKYYESPEIMVRKGDLIISQRGTLGKVVFIDKDYGEMTINPSLVLVNQIKENTLFLWYYLQSNHILTQIDLIGSVTTIPMLSQVEISSFQILIPPLKEQQQIVEYLDEQTQKIDTTTEKETKRIELLKEYRQSLISEVVTGKIDVRDYNG